jgi:chromate transporter
MHAAEPIDAGGPTRVSALDVLSAATRLGLTSFGGPVAHLGYFRREYVERRRWVDETTFGDLTALSQLLPGPSSSQLGIAIGTLKAGYLGGLAAWVGFTLPSAILMIAVALLTTSLGPGAAGWVEGLKLAAVAIVAQAVWVMSRTLTPDAPRRAIAAMAAAVVLLAPVGAVQVLVILTGGLVGWRFLPGSLTTGLTPVQTTIGRRTGTMLLAIFAGLVLLLPLARRVVESQLVAMVDAYYRAGALVFGGGHVVLPLLSDAVVTPGWVGQDRFLAGYGAAQALPGPLFTFAGFLGASSQPAPNGVPGGVLALMAIFLPSFLLVWGVLPFWDRLRASTSFASALRGTNAAVVGILLAALITPVATSALHGAVEVILAAVGLSALVSGRVPPVIVVASLAVAGQALSLA